MTARPDEEVDPLEGAMRIETAAIDHDVEEVVDSDGRRNARTQTKNEREARRGWNGDIEIGHALRDEIERKREQEHQLKTNLESQISSERPPARGTKRIRRSRRKDLLQNQLLWLQENR
jgi:hypothetical protein